MLGLCNLQENEEQLVFPLAHVLQLQSEQLHGFESSVPKPNETEQPVVS